MIRSIFWFFENQRINSIKIYGCKNFLLWQKQEKSIKQENYWIIMIAGKGHSNLHFI